MEDLEPHSTREALTGPSSELGVRWDTDAMETVVELAQGYPYFVQLYADQVWVVAGNPDRGGVLTKAHVKTAQESVNVDLTELHRSRWSKASDREREVLTVMALAGTPEVSRGAIATALGVDTTALSMVRQSLLDKGIVDATKYGYLAFTVPGFGEYVRNVTTH